MKKILLAILLLVVLSTLFCACAPAPTQVRPRLAAQSAAQPSQVFEGTPNPCAPENLTAEVKKVNDLMREFDDASAVASSTPKDNLGAAISELQHIRRAAEDQLVPACLGTLKEYQLEHMNAVIATMLAFLNGADQSVINDGINRARAAHDLFAREVANLLGLTLVPITATVMLPVETSTPTLTPTPTPTP